MRTNDQITYHSSESYNEHPDSMFDINIQALIHHIRSCEHTQASSSPSASPSLLRVFQLSQAPYPLMSLEPRIAPRPLPLIRSALFSPRTSCLILISKRLIERDIPLEDDHFTCFAITTQSTRLCICERLACSLGKENKDLSLGRRIGAGCREDIDTEKMART